MSKLQLLEIDNTKEYEGYIGIEVEKRQKDDTKEYYTWSDIKYSELSRASKPLYLKKGDPTPLFHLFHMGGGFLGGERFRTDLIVKDNTNAIFTSQSASKIYKVREKGKPSTYFVNLEVGDNSIVEFVNDSVILYPNAEYHQFNVFDIKSTSTFFYSEVLSPGYAPDGDKYMYTEMWLNTKLYIDGKLNLYDNLNFNPPTQNPQEFGVMDGFDRCGTGLYINPNITEEMAEEIRKLVKESCSDIEYEFGISNFITHGLGVRVLANQTYEVQRIISLVHNYFREKVLSLDKLDLRKN